MLRIVSTPGRKLIFMSPDGRKTCDGLPTLWVCAPTAFSVSDCSFHASVMASRPV